LFAEVWGYREPGDTQSLRTHITILRKKLGEGPTRPQIVTVSGVGYQLRRPQ
jgi:DNA-binding response OmpR family regulator